MDLGRANIAPINWALGALGIILKLGLWETIAVIVVGNLIGCTIFTAFTVMGRKTGVNQMVLCRSAFGLLGGADLSWLVGIIVSGAVYLVLGRRVVAAPVAVPAGGASE